MHVQCAELIKKNNAVIKQNAWKSYIKVYDNTPVHTCTTAVVSTASPAHSTSFPCAPSLKDQHHQQTLQSDEHVIYATNDWFEQLDDIFLVDSVIDRTY